MKAEDIMLLVIIAAAGIGAIVVELHHPQDPHHRTDMNNTSIHATIARRTS